MPIINKGHELKIGDKLKRVGNVTYNTDFIKKYFAELIGDEKMELKDIKQESLEAGKELVEQQKLSEEIIFAKNEYKRLTDLKDRYEREIKAQKENLDKIFEELKVFGVKKTRKSRV